MISTTPASISPESFVMSSQSLRFSARPIGRSAVSSRLRFFDLMAAKSRSNSSERASACMTISDPGWLYVRQLVNTWRTSAAKSSSVLYRLFMHLSSMVPKSIGCLITWK
eukprot:Amastigsp_a340082_684.p2 type:complete len:110 gc:universal Amastigsp_a340082_684:211-540(+)